MAISAQAPTTYRRVQVEGADPRHLVVLLVRALVKFLLRAREAIEQGDLEDKAVALGRARAILSELNCSLDTDAGCELAHDLRSLYIHWQGELMAADLDEDLDKLDYVLDCVRNMADAWQEAHEACQTQARREVA